ncbi:MAG: nucleotidyltransferase domain-containing protein [Kosmotogaceae bacterium]
MVDKQKILSDLKEHLNQNYNGPINEIVLFGSHARGESTEDSDYDILIVLDNEYSAKDEDVILDLCYDINLKYNILIDAHILSIREIKSIRGKQPIFVNALKAGIHA